MRITHAIARSIEDAEIAALRPVAYAAPRGFWSRVLDGAASFVRPGSPMNKVIGAGLDETLDPFEIECVTRFYRNAGDRARFELATLGQASNVSTLTAHGYDVLGTESVLVRPLDGDVPPIELDVRRVVDATLLRTWRDVYVEAAAVSDETGAVVDRYSAQVVADALDDDLAGAAGDRYVAYLDGVVVGVASMFVRGEVALFNGAATLPAARRRGVQTALVAARLTDATARGCTLATMATAPGSRSEMNAARHGFTVAYERSILVSASVAARARS